MNSQETQMMSAAREQLLKALADSLRKRRAERQSRVTQEEENVMDSDEELEELPDIRKYSSNNDQKEQTFSRAPQNLRPQNADLGPSQVGTPLGYNSSIALPAGRPNQTEPPEGGEPQVANLATNFHNFTLGSESSLVTSENLKAMLSSLNQQLQSSLSKCHPTLFSCNAPPGIDSEQKSIQVPGYQLPAGRNLNTDFNQPYNNLERPPLMKEKAKLIRPAHQVSGDSQDGNDFGGPFLTSEDQRGNQLPLAKASLQHHPSKSSQDSEPRSSIATELDPHPAQQQLAPPQAPAQIQNTFTSVRSEKSLRDHRVTFGTPSTQAKAEKQFYPSSPFLGGRTDNACEEIKEEDAVTLLNNKGSTPTAKDDSISDVPSYRGGGLAQVPSQPVLGQPGQLNLAPSDCTTTHVEEASWYFKKEGDEGSSALSNHKLTPRVGNPLGSFRNFPRDDQSASGASDNTLLDQVKETLSKVPEVPEPIHDSDQITERVTEKSGFQQSQLNFTKQLQAFDQQAKLLHESLQRIMKESQNRSQTSESQIDERLSLPSNRFIAEQPTPELKPRLSHQSAKATPFLRQSTVQSEHVHGTGELPTPTAGDVRASLPQTDRTSALNTRSLINLIQMGGASSSLGPVDLRIMLETVVTNLHNRDFVMSARMQNEEQARLQEEVLAKLNTSISLQLAEILRFVQLNSLLVSQEHLQELSLLAKVMNLHPEEVAIDSPNLGIPIELRKQFAKAVVDLMKQRRQHIMNARQSQVERLAEIRNKLQINGKINLLKKSTSARVFNQIVRASEKMSPTRRHLKMFPTNSRGRSDDRSKTTRQSKSSLASRQKTAMPSLTSHFNKMTTATSHGLKPIKRKKSKKKPSVRAKSQEPSKEDRLNKMQVFASGLKKYINPRKSGKKQGGGSMLRVQSTNRLKPYPRKYATRPEHDPGHLGNSYSTPTLIRRMQGHPEAISEGMVPRKKTTSKGRKRKGSKKPKPDKDTPQVVNVYNNRFSQNNASSIFNIQDDRVDDHHQHYSLPVDSLQPAPKTSRVVGTSPSRKNLEDFGEEAEESRRLEELRRKEDGENSNDEEELTSQGDALAASSRIRSKSVTAFNTQSLKEALHNYESFGAGGQDIGTTEQSTVQASSQIEPTVSLAPDESTYSVNTQQFKSKLQQRIEKRKLKEVQSKTFTGLNPAKKQRALERRKSSHLRIEGPRQTGSTLNRLIKDPRGKQPSGNLPQTAGFVMSMKSMHSGGSGQFSRSNPYGMSYALPKDDPAADNSFFGGNDETGITEQPSSTFDDRQPLRQQHASFGLDGNNLFAFEESKTQIDHYQSHRQGAYNDEPIHLLGNPSAIPEYENPQHSDSMDPYISRNEELLPEGSAEELVQEPELLLSERPTEMIISDRPEVLQTDRQAFEGQDAQAQFQEQANYYQDFYVQAHPEPLYTDRLQEPASNLMDYGEEEQVHFCSEEDQQLPYQLAPNYEQQQPVQAYEPAVIKQQTKGRKKSKSSRGKPGSSGDGWI